MAWTDTNNKVRERPRSPDHGIGCQQVSHFMRCDNFSRRSGQRAPEMYLSLYPMYCRKRSKQVAGPIKNRTCSICCDDCQSGWEHMGGHAWNGLDWGFSQPASSKNSFILILHATYVLPPRKVAGRTAKGVTRSFSRGRVLLLCGVSF